MSRLLRLLGLLLCRLGWHGRSYRTLDGRHRCLRCGADRPPPPPRVPFDPSDGFSSSWE